MDSPGTDAVTAARVRDALARRAAGPAWEAGGYAREAERGVAAYLLSRYPRLGHMILAAYEWHRARVAGSVTGWSARWPVPLAAGAVIAGAPLPPPGALLHARAAQAAPGTLFAYAAPHPFLADVMAAEAAGPSAGRVQVALARAADPDAVMGSAPVREITAAGPAAVHLVLVPARWDPVTAARAVARYAELVPPGSTVSLSVITAEPGRRGAAMMGDAALAGGPGYCHRPADVERWLRDAGLVLHPAGARASRSWRAPWGDRYPAAGGPAGRDAVPGRVTVAAGLKPGG